MSTKERRGRKLHTWTAPEQGGSELEELAGAAGAPVALPCRQELEEKYPEAVMPIEELRSLVEAFRATLEQTSAAKANDVDGVPVVVVSHVWRTESHPDPDGTTLQAVAKQLAQQLPTYQAWGCSDVGVLFDWCSLYQDTTEYRRSPSQVESFVRAKREMYVDCASNPHSHP